MEQELKRLDELRVEIAKLYKEKNELESKVIESMISNGDKSIPTLDDTAILTLKWIYEKKIDYVKLESLHPHVYELGLMTTFSANKCLLAMDRKVFNEVLKTCTAPNNHYELKRESKKYVNSKERFNRKSNSESD